MRFESLTANIKDGNCISASLVGFVFITLMDKSVGSEIRSSCCNARIHCTQIMSGVDFYSYRFQEIYSLQQLSKEWSVILLL